MIKYNQKGRSMVEMLGVIAIVGVLSVGGFDMYAKAMQKKQISEIKSNNCHGNTQNNELAIEKEKIVSRSMSPPMATQFLPLRKVHLFSGHFKLQEHTSQC